MNTTILTTSIISLFLFFIIVGFVFGWFRGLNKSLVRFIMVLAVAVLAFFVIPPISKAILEMDISKFNLVIGGKNVITVDELIIDLLRQVPFIEDILDASGTFSSFIQAIPQMLANVVLFIVFFFLIKWISMIIYWIIAGVCFNKKKTAGKEKHSFIGAVIGALQGLVVAIVVFVPVFGIFETAQPFVQANRAYVQQTAEQTASGEKDDQITEALSEVGKYTDAVKNNWIYKVSNAIGIKQLSVAMFDGLTTIKKGKVEYGLRNETKVIAKAYPYLRPLIDGKFDIQDNECLENVRKAINELYKSKALSGTVGEVVKYAADLWTNEDDPNLTFCGIKRPNFKDEDIDSLFTAILTSLKNGNPNDFKLDVTTGIELVEIANDADLLKAVAGDKNIMDVFKNSENDNLIADIIDKALESPTLKSVLPKIVDVGMNYVYEALGVDKATIGSIPDIEVTNWENERTILQDIFKNVFKIYDEMNSSTEENKLYSLDFERVGLVIDDLRRSELLGDASYDIMTAILTKADILGTDNDVLKNLTDKLQEDWDDTSKSLAPTFKAIGEAVVFAKDLQQSIEGGFNPDNLESIVDALADAKNAGNGNIVDELLSSETLAGLGLDQGAADVIDEALSALVDAKAEGGDITADLEAAKTVFDVANDVLNADGEVDLSDKVDGLVDQLADSQVLLDQLSTAAENAGVDGSSAGKVLTEKMDETTKQRLEEKVKGVEDQDAKEKLAKLFGITL